MGELAAVGYAGSEARRWWWILTHMQFRQAGGRLDRMLQSKGCKEPKMVEQLGPDIHFVAALTIGIHSDSILVAGRGIEADRGYRGNDIQPRQGAYAITASGRQLRDRVAGTKR
jgi:hypothetical protein